MEANNKTRFCGTLTPPEVKTEGKGTPLSPGPWGSRPGPEFSRSRRLEPSCLGWDMLEPSSRLLKSLGLEAEEEEEAEEEGLDSALSESRPNGGRLSRPIMERSDPGSGAGGGDGRDGGSGGGGREGRECQRVTHKSTEPRWSSSHLYF